MKPATRISLIQRLLDHDDDEAWEAFDAIYRPVVIRLLKQWGLQDHDCHEVSQEVFAAVAKSIHGFTYQQREGSFRGWLATITRNKMADLIKDRQKNPAAQGGSDFHVWLSECPDPSTESTAGISRWDIERRRALFHWAAKQVQSAVQPATWHAFQQTAYLGRPAAQVAGEMNTSIGWVYVARSRVLARLREVLAHTGELEINDMEIGDAL